MVPTSVRRGRALLLAKGVPTYWRKQVRPHGKVVYSTKLGLLSLRPRFFRDVDRSVTILMLLSPGGAGPFVFPTAQF